MIVGSSGIDESNGSEHYVLYPKDPFASAQKLRTWLMRTYNVETLGVIITDSTSIPLRRGAIGFALAWDGIDPMRDYRGTKDLFGRTIRIEVANIIDALAASAVLVMGEGAEQTPVAIIRDAPGIVFKNRGKGKEQLIVAPENDLFAPLLWRRPWKRGGATDVKT
jgi:F420-0:gamma-glutamyl ligase